MMPRGSYRYVERAVNRRWPAIATRHHTPATRHHTPRTRRR